MAKPTDAAFFAVAVPSGMCLSSTTCAGGGTGGGCGTSFAGGGVLARPPAHFAFETGREGAAPAAEAPAAAPAPAGRAAEDGRGAAGDGAGGGLCGGSFGNLTSAPLSMPKTRQRREPMGTSVSSERGPAHLAVGSILGRGFGGVGTPAIIDNHNMHDDTIA